MNYRAASRAVSKSASPQDQAQQAAGYSSSRESGINNIPFCIIHDSGFYLNSENAHPKTRSQTP
jgi:hypothetical protein